MGDEFSRTELLIGREGCEKLRGKTILVFGLGGVGSHCTEALARCGIGRLILVDNDKVELSNLNRQSIAYHSTIGRQKTEVMRERIADICPDTQVQTFETFVLPENLNTFFPEPEGDDDWNGTSLSARPDYIIDAIDTVTAKVAIAERAVRIGVPIISCMGTGNKLHADRFEIADLSQTSVCPLCRVMRRELKERGIEHLKVLYSKEKPLQTKGTSPNGGRTPGSISFVPPVAGLLIAGEVIRDLLGISEDQSMITDDK